MYRARWGWGSSVPLVVNARAAGRYSGKGGWNVSGWAALLAGVGAALLTVSAPILTGPVARLLHGATCRGW